MLLIARAVLLSSVTVLLGVAGHLVVAGQTPGPATVITLLAATFVVSLGLLRAPAGPRRIVSLLVGGQAAVHLALMATAGHAPAPGATGHLAAGGLALPLADGHRVGSLQDSHDVATGHVDLASLGAGRLGDTVAGHAPQLLVHLLVALALALVLALGERSLWTLIALLTATVLRLLSPIAIVAPSRPAVRAPVRRRPRPLLLLAPTVVRRGPPAALGTA